MERLEGEKVEPFAAAAEALELPKILDLVAREVISPPAKALIYDLKVLSDPEAITHELGRVSEVRSLLDRGEDLPLETVEDLQPVFETLAIAGSTLSPPALVELARVARMAAHVRAFFSDYSETLPLLQAVMTHLRRIPDLPERVEQSIDFHSFEILDSASPTLKRIRRDIEAAQEEARRTLQHVLKRLAAREMLQEQLITVREGRLVLMVKDEHKRNIPGIVHDQSATGQTLFIEPMETVEINNRIRQLQAREQQEIERILAELTELAREEKEALEQNYHLLLTLDALRARAKYSQNIGGNAPLITNSRRLILYAARHPLLLEKYGDPQKVVPLHLRVGETFQTLVITGPNAGGKTVALKTVGLCVLMARMGLHIPASADTEIGVMGRVFVDIGDQQSIEHDLSTFTSHMVNLRRILQEATAGDLVLIDEIGSGTDPEEGSAIAMAALSQLNRRQVLTVVTTHHGALKVFAHNTPGVENGSMVFNLDTLEPTYEFRPGVPGASYAFEIARRIGLQEDIIEQAREKVGSGKDALEKLIADLEKRIQEQDEKIKQLRLEETRLNGLIKLYQERAEELARSRRELKQKAIAESEAILARANAAVEQAIREIREKQASREAIQATRARLEQERETLRRERQALESENEASGLSEAGPSPRELQPGVTVLWRPQNSHAVVLEAPDGDNRVYLQAGPLKIRVPLSEVQIVQSAPRKGKGNVRIEKSEPVPGEIDVRGMRVDEALAAVDRYLSEALLYGWEEVRIIHGKGTGVLRKAIADFLRRHPNVAGFEPAPLGMGDIGVTVVKF